MINLVPQYNHSRNIKCKDIKKIKMAKVVGIDLGTICHN